MTTKKNVKSDSKHRVQTETDLGSPQAPDASLASQVGEMGQSVNALLNALTLLALLSPSDRKRIDEEMRHTPREIVLEVVRVAADRGGSVLGYALDAQAEEAAFQYRATLLMVAQILEMAARRLRDDGDQRYVEFVRQAQAIFGALRTGRRSKAGRALAPDYERIANVVREYRPKRKPAKAKGKATSKGETSDAGAKNTDSPAPPPPAPAPAPSAPAASSAGGKEASPTTT